MKSWLRGGLVGVILSFVLVLIYFFIDDGIVAFFLLPLAPGFIESIIWSSGLLLAFIYYPLIYFIFGVIIGLIIDRSKNKNPNFSSTT